MSSDNSSSTYGAVWNTMRGVIVKVACATLVPVTILVCAATTELPSTNSNILSTQFVEGSISAREARFTAIRRLSARAGTIVNTSVIKSAAHICDQLPVALPSPQCSFSEDGEIGLSWYRVGKRFAAIVGPELNLAWVYIEKGKITRGDQVEIWDPSLDAFYVALAHFYGDQDSRIVS